MRKYLIAGLAGSVVLAVAWVAVGQPQPQGGPGGPGQGPGGGGRGGMGGRGFMNREAQLKAITTMQEQLGKLKTSMEAPMPGMPAGGDFQNMSDDDRAKMREAMTKRREEQQQAVAAIEKEMVQLRGIRAVITENEQSTSELKALQELATKEKATETAKKVGEMIAAKQKKFEETVKAMGLDPANLPQMGRGMGGGMGGGQRGPGQGQ